MQMLRRNNRNMIAVMIVILSFITLVSGASAEVRNLDSGECYNFTAYTVNENNTVIVSNPMTICSKIISASEYLDTINSLKENMTELKVQVARVTQENEDLTPAVSEYKDKYLNSENRYSGISQQLSICTAERSSSMSELAILKKNPTVIDENTCGAIGMEKETFWTRWGIVAGVLLVIVVHKYTKLLDGLFNKKKEEDESGQDETSNDLAGLNV